LLLIKFYSFGKAVEFYMLNAGNDRVIGNVFHEKKSKTTGAMIRMNNYVEHQCFENLICENAGKSAKLL